MAFVGKKNRTSGNSMLTRYNQLELRYAAPFRQGKYLQVTTYTFHLPGFTHRCHLPHSCQHVNLKLYPKYYVFTNSWNRLTTEI